MSFTKKTSFNEFSKIHSNNTHVSKFCKEAQELIFDHINEVQSWSSNEIEARGLTEAFDYLPNGELNWESFFVAANETSYAKIYSENKDVIEENSNAFIHILIGVDGLAEALGVSFSDLGIRSKHILKDNHKALLGNNEYLVKAVAEITDFLSAQDSADHKGSPDFSYIHLTNGLLLDLGI